MITHTAYFEALASIEDETSPEWNPTLAGLVVLRLVDDWLDMGAQIVTTDITGLRAVRAAVALVSEGDPVNAILAGIIDTLEQAEVATIQVISSRLFAYAQALRYSGQWTLAQDVLSGIRDRAEVAGDKEILTQAALHLGPMLRELGSLDAAEEAFSCAMQIAETTGDIVSRLRAQIGRAKIILARGNLPAGESVLESVLLQAKTCGLPQQQGEALQELANLAYLRSRYDVTIQLAYRALEYATDSISRERILAQIAVSFALLGHLQASRDANLILASTAQEQEIRLNAHINLMYVAILEGHELAFEQYRSSLECEVLPPRTEAHYRLDAARGLVKFGHLDLAQAELSKARGLAERYVMNQLIFEIDTVSIEQPVSQTNIPSEWSAEIDSIASTIGEWRQLQDNVTSKTLEGVAE